MQWSTTPGGGGYGTEKEESKYYELEKFQYSERRKRKNIVNIRTLLVAHQIPIFD